MGRVKPPGALLQQQGVLPLSAPLQDASRLVLLEMMEEGKTEMHM